jgi:hypothetical protein
MENGAKLKYIVLTTIIVLFFAVFFRYDVLSKVFSSISGSNNPKEALDNVKNIDNGTNINNIVDPDIDNPKTTEKRMLKYVEIKGSCGPHYEGICINVRTGPGTQYPSKLKLRNGIVLQVEENSVTADGREWYKIKFDEFLFFPERVDSDLYVAADFVNVIYNEGNKTLKDEVFPNIKTIIVDLSEQTLYAYEGEELFIKQSVSTGLDKTPTRVGEFKIFKKTPSRYMQGSSDGPEDQFYDLPGVPWDLYFTHDGNVIHGAYWHNSFGRKWSHGCVNLPVDKSKELYEWAPVGTTVIVQD